VVSDEEVFEIAEQHEAEEAAAGEQGNEGTDSQRRRSARKKRKINYNQDARQQKKSRDQGDVGSLDLGSDREEVPEAVNDQYANLTAMIAALGQKFEKNLDNQEGKIHHRLDNAVGSLQKSLDGAVGALNSRVNHLTEDMKAVKERVDQLNPDAIKAVVDERISSALAKLERPEIQDRQLCPPGRDQREAAEYWRARASLRLAPVEGPDLRQGVEDFLVAKLGLEKSIMGGIGEADIKRVHNRPNDKVQKEVIVKFKSIEDRDHVKSSGFKLAGQQGTYLRLELPRHLLGPHRILARAGQKIRQASKGCKTNLKYDDEAMGLVLDLKPEGGDWTRLRPESAKEAMQDLPTLRETTPTELATLLGGRSLTTGANALNLGQSSA
jgi:hypothetical protein